MAEANNAPRRPDEVVSLLRAAATTQELITARDEALRRAAHYEKAHAAAETEVVVLREALDKMTAERDGYFQDATTLRSTLTSAAHSITNAVNTITGRQVYSRADDGAEIPKFLQQGPATAPNGRPTKTLKPSDILKGLSAAIAGDADESEERPDREPLKSQRHATTA
jgi:hypothetical protein